MDVIISPSAIVRHFEKVPSVFVPEVERPPHPAGVQLEPAQQHRSCCESFY